VIELLDPLHEPARLREALADAGGEPPPRRA
jgi:hypothetical protein